MVARQWHNVPENEKKSWKQRAKLASASQDVTMNNEMEYDDDEDIVDDGNGSNGGEEDDNGDEQHGDNGNVDNVEDVVIELVGADHANGNNGDIAAQEEE